MNVDYFDVKKMTASMLQGVDACMEKEAFTSAATLILTRLDTLGGFLAGREATSATFGPFVDRYMSILPQMESVTGKTREEATNFLYDKFRCGFVHEYLSKKGTGITRERPYVSLEDGLVVIDINVFREDFAQALRRFKQDVQNNAEGIGDNYSRRVRFLRERPQELFIKLADAVGIQDTPQTSVV